MKWEWCVAITEGKQKRNVESHRFPDIEYLDMLEARRDNPHRLLTHTHCTHCHPGPDGGEVGAQVYSRSDTVG